eukprot:scaffold5017_cov171-Amphora_coffeaeformis.AAC.3
MPGILAKEIEDIFIATGRFRCETKHLGKSRLNRSATRFGDVMICNITMSILFTVLEHLYEFVGFVEEKDRVQRRRDIVTRRLEFIVQVNPSGGVQGRCLGFVHFPKCWTGTWWGNNGRKGIGSIIAICARVAT